jgi:hypothetical protein
LEQISGQLAPPVNLFYAQATQFAAGDRQGLIALLVITAASTLAGAGPHSRFSPPSSFPSNEAVTVCNVREAVPSGVWRYCMSALRQGPFSSALLRSTCLLDASETTVSASGAVLTVRLGCPSKTAAKRTAAQESKQQLLKHSPSHRRRSSQAHRRFLITRKRQMSDTSAGWRDIRSDI